MRLFIFDLDGTLVDTIGDIKYSCDKALKKIGLKETTFEVVRRSIGDGTINLIERVISHQTKSNSQLVDKALIEYRKAYGEIEGKRSKPFSDIYVVLKKLKDNGNRFAVLSNKNHCNIEKALQNFYPDINFEIVIGGDDNFAIKPNAEGLEYIIRRLNVNKSDTIFIGDGETDVMVAKNAGVMGISCLWGYREKEELEKYGAVNFISSPLEILSI